MKRVTYLNGLRTLSSLGIILILGTGMAFAWHFTGKFWYEQAAHGFTRMPADLQGFIDGARAVRTQHDPYKVMLGLSPFIYPPPFLLLILPFTFLPPWLLWGAWEFAGVIFFCLCARMVGLPWFVLAMALISPVTMMDIPPGQNGLFISGLLLVAMRGAQRGQDRLAGLAAAAMIIKPQFALLLPICFLAHKNHRAFGWAAGGSVALIAISMAVFGQGLWESFVREALLSGGSVLNAPWPTTFEVIMVAPLIALKSIGFSNAYAAAGQAVVSASCVFGAWRLWRPGCSLDEDVVLAVTMCLVMLVTPYGFIYDMLGVAAAMALVATRGNYVPMAVFWLLSGADLEIVGRVGILPVPLFLPFLAFSMVLGRPPAPQRAGGASAGFGT